MFEFDTPFRRAVRSLKSPNSADYDAAEWKRRFESSDPTEADLNLYAMALWLYAQSTSLRQHIEQNPLPPLSAKLSMTLAIAMLNRECSVVGRKFGKAQKVARAGGSLSVDHLASIGIGRSDGIFEVDAASITDAATDAVDSWLYEAVGAKGTLRDYADLGTTAVRYVQRFSIQHSHYDLWQRALWEDWRLASDGQSQFMFAPSDRGLATLLDACLIRKQSNFMEYVWIDASAWPQMSPQRRREIQLPRTVVSIERKSGRPRSFVLGRPTTTARFVPAYLVGRAGLEGSYLSPFLERELPTSPCLTCELLVRAWYVIHDLADVLAAARPRATFHNLENVRQWALVTKKHEIVDILTRALPVTGAVAEEIVEFFCWKRGPYKGLWGAPLVPLPGSDDLAIAHNVLATSNVVRRVEIWLTKGGLDDNLSSAARGSSYEANLRAEIRAELADNQIVKDRACAENAIKKSADCSEQVDLLVQFASLLLVGEIKCLLFPADSRERYNFLRKLRDAAAQATRKATFLRTRRDIVARALSISPEKAQSLRVLPIVVMNQGFGMSLMFDDCVVTDAKFLKLYLGSGKYVSEAAVNRVDGNWAQAERFLYRNEGEAADNFEESMRRPPPLYRFVDRLRWTTFGFPTHSGVPLFIARSELSDVAGETRERYEMLGAVVDKQTLHLK
jgi:hypothetical protein